MKKYIGLRLVRFDDFKYPLCLLFHSCDRVAWLEENAFLKFEGCMFVLAALSCLSVFWRENILRKRIIRKVARQLRTSVC